MRIKKEEMRFPIGRVVTTPGALQLMRREGTLPFEYIRRHVKGDWGDLCEEDKEANELAIKDGGRVMSAYKLSSSGEMLWVITEGDRNHTTFLLPSEY